MIISFYIEGEVMGMPRPRSTIINNHIRVYETSKSKKHKEQISMAYRIAAGSLHPSLPQLKEGTGYKVRIIICKLPPKSFSKKKTEAALAGKIQPTVKPDVDNVAKTILDALNGVAWRDDSEITSLIIMKTYAKASCAKVSIEWEEK